MTADVFDVVVIGAGVAGLAVAHDLAAPDPAGAHRSVVVLEAGDRVGGLLRRADVGGVPVDIGAEAFAVRTTGVADLVADARLDLEIVTPAPGGAHLVVRGDDGLLRAPLPERAVLGIPADPLADDVVRILGEAGAARAAAEAAFELGGEEPSLAALVARRCGDALVERLVDPLCRSVYSVPASQARLSRLHPALWREFLARGSLLAAADAIAAPTRAGAAVAGIAGGMWRFAEALATAAQERGAQVRLGTPALTLTADDRRVTVETSEGTVTARRAVVATGAVAARRLLGAPEVEAAPVRVVVARIDAPVLDAFPVGSGVIVGADVPTAAKALTHVTAKWPWAAHAVAAAPPGGHLVRLSARDAAAPGLDTAADVAREVSMLTGVEIDESAVTGLASAVWNDAVAVRPVDADHERRLAGFGVRLAGASVAGTGLASVIPHARALARELAGDLPAAGSAPGIPSDPTLSAPTSRRNA